jgi:hypothetical protein
LWFFSFPSKQAKVKEKQNLKNKDFLKAKKKMKIKIGKTICFFYKFIKKHCGIPHKQILKTKKK